MVFCRQFLRTSISGAVWRILMRNAILIALLRLPLALILFILVTPATAGSFTETDKSVRSIVSGIVSYTRWPALSGQPKLLSSVFMPLPITDRRSAVKIYTTRCPIVLSLCIAIGKHFQPGVMPSISGVSPRQNNRK